MKPRRKILVLEQDDFLREIIGNLLHKKGGYILTAFSISEGIRESQGHKIDTVILSTSCPEYRGKETLSYIKKELDQDVLEFYVINYENEILNFIESHQQMLVEDLSLRKILNTIEV